MVTPDYVAGQSSPCVRASRLLAPTEFDEEGKVFCLGGGIAVRELTDTGPRQLDVERGQRRDLQLIQTSGSVHSLLLCVLGGKGVDTPLARKLGAPLRHFLVFRQHALELGRLQIIDVIFNDRFQEGRQIGVEVPEVGDEIGM